MSEQELSEACVFIPDRLYFATLSSEPRQSNQYHFFNVDNDLVYEPFFADFGPLNLANLYRFCKILNEKLEHPDLASKQIVFYSSHDAHKRANAAALIACYAVICQDMNPTEAYEPFRGLYPPLVPFRDASMGVCTFNLTVRDCVRAIYKAKLLEWFDLETFDLEKYQYFDQVETGDLNVVLPNKFVAFSGPSAEHILAYDGSVTLGPEDYSQIFNEIGVSAVVRLSKKVYDKKKFLDSGIRHYDMYFQDGGTPSEAIVRRFCEICEEETGQIAVHCKAGLGRTGLLIGCYMMKHFRFSAGEAIAWLRMSRPGSVIGPQQSFLVEIEEQMWRLGQIYRVEHGAPPAGGPLMLPTELWGEEQGTVAQRTLSAFGHQHPQLALKTQAAALPASVDLPRAAHVNNALQPKLNSAGVPSDREIRQAGLVYRPTSGYSFGTNNRNDLLSSPSSRTTSLRGRAKTVDPPPQSPTLSAPSSHAATFKHALVAPQSSQPQRL